MGWGAATAKPRGHQRIPLYFIVFPGSPFVFPDSDRGPHHTVVPTQPSYRPPPFVLPDPDTVPTVGHGTGAATTQTHESNKHPRTPTPLVRASLVGALWWGPGAATTSTPFVSPDSDRGPTPSLVLTAKYRLARPHYSSYRTPIRYPRWGDSGARLPPKYLRIPPLVRASLVGAPWWGPGAATTTLTPVIPTRPTRHSRAKRRISRPPSRPPSSSPTPIGDPPLPCHAGLRSGTGAATTTHTLVIPDLPHVILERSEESPARRTTTPRQPPPPNFPRGISST